MNVLFNSALKQSTQLRADLDTFADLSSISSPTALQGQISTTLTSFSRTLDDYATTTTREPNASKQEKARDRLATFRSELADYRARFTALKSARDDRQTAVARTELLGRRPHHTATPENPYTSSIGGGNSSSNPYAAANLPSSSAFAPAAASSSGLGFGVGPGSQSRETHALREQSFFAQGNAQLDEYLERGRAVLGNLSDQRDVLKGTQRKLYSVATTLGVSGETIRMVERRATEDKWMFWGGIAVFVVFVWLVLRYLR